MDGKNAVVKVIKGTVDSSAFPTIAHLYELLDPKFDKADSSSAVGWYRRAMIDAMNALNFKLSDTASVTGFYRRGFMDLLLSLKLNTADVKQGAYYSDTSYARRKPDSTRVNDLLGLKQDIINNLSDTSKYFESMDSSGVYGWYRRGYVDALLNLKQNTILNIGDTVKYFKAIDSSSSNGFYRRGYIDALLNGKQYSILNLGDTSKYFKSYDTSGVLGFYRRGFIDALLNAKQNTILNLADTSKYAKSTDSTLFYRRLYIDALLNAKQNLILNLADTSKYFEQLDSSSVYGWYRRAYVDALIASKQNVIANLADTSKYFEAMDSAGVNGWYRRAMIDAMLNTKQAVIANLADTSKYQKMADSASATGWYRRGYVDALVNAKQNVIANLADTSKYFEAMDSAGTNGWYRRAYIDALLSGKSPLAGSASITTVGTLISGAIGSGFTAIDTGKTDAIGAVIAGSGISISKIGGHKYQIINTASTAAPDSSAGHYSTQTMDALKQPILDSVLYVSTGIFADGIKTFNTITAACSAWTAGKVIYLAPQTFGESVTLDKAGMSIYGMSRDKSIITNLTITGKDVSVSDITVSGNFSHICADALLYYKWSTIKNVLFQGDVSIGSSGTQNLYTVRFFNCWLNGSGKHLIVNSETSMHSVVFDNCEIFSLDNQYSFNIYQGLVAFKNCLNVRWYDFNYTSDTYLMHVDIYNCRIWFAHDFVTSATNPRISVLAIYDSNIYKLQAYSGAWTFDGYFELIMARCSWFYPNLIFNSLANSRIIDVVGLGIDSPYTISGSGLINLHIQKSIFHCAAPAGLGEDNANIWQAFIDN